MSFIIPRGDPEMTARGLSPNSAFSLTIVGLASLCGLLVLAGWTAKGYMADIKADSIQIRADIVTLRTELRNTSQTQAGDKWGRSDQQQWAFQLQKLNNSLRVPEIASTPSQQRSPE
jgi:hypothetical protein